ncbi:MAG: hypothetical protein AAF721_24960, partial [Myxococcota bacterium]
MFGATDQAPTLSRYRLRGRAGAGGAGVVYQAHDPELDRRVAIKFLHRAGIHGDTVGRAHLRSEAQALA